MSVLRYTKQKNGTFKKEGSVKERYVNIRIFRNNVWKEPITPCQRTTMVELLETSSPEYLPGDIYELIGVASTMTEEDKEKLRQVKKRKLAERGESPEPKKTISRLRNRV